VNTLPERVRSAAPTSCQSKHADQKGDGGLPRHRVRAGCGASAQKHENRKAQAREKPGDERPTPGRAAAEPLAEADDETGEDRRKTAKHVTHAEHHRNVDRRL
jgi:hypothetical protein